MKSIPLLFTLFILALVSTFHAQANLSAADSAAIRGTAMDYTQGSIGRPIWGGGYLALTPGEGETNTSLKRPF